MSSIKLEKIINGGQALGTKDDGQKALVWCGLPGEIVTIRKTKSKTTFIEGVVEEVIQSSPERITPKDPESYMSTSPWQIMNFEAEQAYKSQAIVDAFRLHHIELNESPDIYTDSRQYGYRNKIEFSWYGDTDGTTGEETLDLAFFRRGSKGKIVIDGTSLAPDEINKLAREVRDLLRKKKVSARQLKTILIRSNQQRDCVWQLYVKDESFEDKITKEEARQLSAIGGEIIYSNPKSPASVITKRIAKFGDVTLKDNVLGTSFYYAAESFFQINIPVYEQALKDMSEWVESRPTVDLYAGVGSIGLTIGGDDVTLVEINQSAVDEMKRNIVKLGKKAEAILAPSEKSLEYISNNKNLIVDPPRAGLHSDVVARILEVKPKRVTYLSCNPVTQARDVGLLLESYEISKVKGYNFFPRTPHIESLVVLDLKN